MSEEKKEKPKPKGNKKLAVILIRGLINVSHDKKKTLALFRLLKKHCCVVIDDNVIMRGMANKVKDYVTWGEASDETIKLLKDKRGQKDPMNPKELKKFFCLAPPVGGFERGGIKQQFKQGGALGYRADKINELIKKMI